MITRHRASHSVDSSRPKISYPIPVDQYDFTPASAPPTKSTSPTPRARVPASTSMARNWLSRASTSSSGSNAPYTPSKPVRISEPKLSSAFDAFTNRRRGPLGSGATVVRTPHDALAGSTASVYDTGSARTSRIRSQEVPVGIEVLPTSPLSPPLPPIPDEAEEAETEVEPEVPAACSTTPPRPSRAPPPTPEDPDNSSTPTPLQRVRSAIKNTTPPQSEYSPPVPELPANIPTSPPQPAFEPILVSSIPTTPIDPAKLIVSVETSTNTHRTTLKTLLSRPSYLATYVKSILPSREMDEMSLRSQTSEAESSFNSIFHNHLTSSGFLHQSSTTIHIFLDRPSAP